jgi:acyl-CoA dehydrogenase
MTPVTLASVAGIGLAVFALAFAGRGYWAWLCVCAAAAVGATRFEILPAAAAWPVALALAVLAGFPPLRRHAVSRWVMQLLAPTVPPMSETERTALQAGTVWWDGELFSGKPDWKKMLAFRVQELSEREQAFLDGPVEELCRLLDDWQINLDGDLAPQVWEFLKRERFFGMIIPEEYGGLGFSARAHSAVVTKLSTRAPTAAVTVMVPNSLGPGELLLHYGTDEQKRRYLPGLARGEEVPCFALTGPEAGSDAAATASTGVVCRGRFEGRDVLGMRLDWNKRYITLAPIATVIGLAFRLRDPDHLLGETEDLGITCALIPAGLPGVEIGRRHAPMGASFLNGPTTGKDVFVPLDFIIGGREMAGQGWRMLMESLAAGRSISLPALAAAAAQAAARVGGAYATVREQFGLPIGRFEGIEEPLARIAGHSYFMNAARRLTAGAVDAGEKPSVLSAVVKAYLTEGMRRVLSDVMDVLAGAGICLGPRNVLGRGFASVPIAITVEGANILTRTLIIYGQGAIRCHPFVHDEMEAMRRRDLAAFDRAFFGHLGFVSRCMARSIFHSLTGARFARPVPGPAGEYLGRISRLSAGFAFVSDVAMATLGGSLKRKEKISGRFADALAWLYLATASVKRFWDEGQPREDLPFLRYSCEHALFQVQEALRGILDNLPSRAAATLARPVVFPFGPRCHPPSDRLGSEVARLLLDGRVGRERLSRDVFVPPAEEPGLGRLEAALADVVRAQEVRRRLRSAVKERRLQRKPAATLAQRGLAAGVIDAVDMRVLEVADAARDDAIQVDSFDPGRFPVVGVPRPREGAREEAAAR